MTKLDQLQTNQINEKYYNILSIAVPLELRENNYQRAELLQLQQLHLFMYLLDFFY